jgi:signal transduction histidine kinase
LPAEPPDTSRAPGRRAASTATVDVAARLRGILNENQRLFGQLLEGERRYRGLARAVWQVQEEERRRLARELHDGIGQILTALKNQLERIERRAAGDAPELAPQLADAVDLAGAALRDTRELSRLLRPPVLDDLGLAAALRWLARTMGERTELAVELDWRLPEERLPAELETLIFRVVQEALTNALKHSGAEGARVEVERAGATLVTRISDPGAGFDPAAALAPGGDPGGAGYGLRGMRDRVELFGGRLAVRSAPGEGTVLELELPAPAAAGSPAGDGGGGGAAADAAGPARARGDV